METIPLTDSLFLLYLNSHNPRQSLGLQVKDSGLLGIAALDVGKKRVRHMTEGNLRQDGRVHDLLPLFY